MNAVESLEARQRHSVRQAKAFSSAACSRQVPREGHLQPMNQVTDLGPPLWSPIACVYLDHSLQESVRSMGNRPCMK